MKGIHWPGVLIGLNHSALPTAAAVVIADRRNCLLQVKLNLRTKGVNCLSTVPAAPAVSDWGVMVTLLSERIICILLGPDQINLDLTWINWTKRIQVFMVLTMSNPRPDCTLDCTPTLAHFVHMCAVRSRIGSDSLSLFLLVVGVIAVIALAIGLSLAIVRRYYASRLSQPLTISS
eukprot:SAG11_NODE_934_length_6487_cov_19.842204_1_plen_176_part_00